MAKQYNFYINLQQAIFDGIHVSIPYGGSNSRYGEHPFTGTLAQAIVKRQELSNAESRPHAASIRMANRNDRKPAGYNDVKFLYNGS